MNQQANHKIDEMDNGGHIGHIKHGEKLKKKTARVSVSNGHNSIHKAFHDEHKVFNTVEANYLKETYDHEVASTILAHSMGHTPKLGRNPILGDVTTRSPEKQTDERKPLTYSSSATFPDPIDEDFQKFVATLEDVKVLTQRREMIATEMKALDELRALKQKLEINPPIPKRNGINFRVVNAKRHPVASPSFTFK